MSNPLLLPILIVILGLLVSVRNPKKSKIE
jgi:hypothetical protein